MKWLQRLRGLDFPDPVVGQVWRSEWNGELMRVTRADIHCTGTLFVAAAVWLPNGIGDRGPCWCIPDGYCVGLAVWRRRLREEKRVLVTHEIEKGNT